MTSVQGVEAFSVDTYAESSVLSAGNWVKVSVKESGMHFLSATELRRMGFADPMRVRVYGYGAVRLPDCLEQATYIDDLPLVQSVNTAGVVYFYATGPVDYVTAVNTQFTIQINPFTTLGYYYLTDSDVELRELPTVSGNATMPKATTYQDVIYHKAELMNAGETGHVLLGEDFLTQNTRTFTLSMPGCKAGSQAWLECSFYACSTSSSRVVFSVNDSALPYASTDNLAGTTDHYAHATQSLTRKTFEAPGDRVRIAITHSRTGNVSLARLNYLVVNYERELALSGGVADFRLVSRGGSLQGGGDGTRVWDVTDPLNIKVMATEKKDGALEWSPMAVGVRHYVAWQENATLPTPKLEGPVSNQNLHARQVPDMVIFAHSDWLSQAERVANLHRESEDSLDVLVVDPETLYNEFSSGAADANALRKLLKMFWDRSETDGRRLRYALIMGRSVYDNRRITPVIASLNYKTLPGWQTDNSLHDNYSYTTDDIYAMLKDGAGVNRGSDYQCIAVGRMPVVSLQDARNVVDKLYSYVKTPVNAEWKNRALMVADDRNSGLFMEHTEAMIERAMSSPGSERIVWDKVYLDAYQQQNSTYPGARNDMFRALNEGVVWWNFAGHANPTSWTGDGLMTYTDVNNLYLKHFPFVVAVTCDFVRWDASSISAAEILYRNVGSGIIGAISATRPAYIDHNGTFMSMMGPHMFALDENGRNLPIGEIFRRTKNGSTTNGVWNNDNKLRYVLMGDPAMRLCTPSLKVELDSIANMVPDLEQQPTIMACQDVRLKGSVRNEQGEVITDFDGKLNLTLYDAEYSTTSNGYGDDSDPGKEVTFEQQGKRLQVVIDSVRGGTFDVNLIMPTEISNNFRPAALNMYAAAKDGRDAVGVCRDFYVYGIDENAVEDTEAPVIEAFYLNHSSFSDGDMVNTTPVAIANISDNRSINLSSAGIGHQMLLTIDGRSLTDAPLYYTPNSDGTSGGTLVYKLDELSPGNHSLRLRVWDTSGNSTSSTIDFSVGRGVAPRLYDMYADVNPASTDTRFYLTHDRPDALITVNIEVFSMLGRRVWSTQVNGMSDTLRSFPVTWNLTDDAGRRVPRGIYIYRASITTSTGECSQTESRRIAVTAG